MTRIAFALAALAALVVAWLARRHRHEWVGGWGGVFACRQCGARRTVPMPTVALRHEPFREPWGDC
jgi:hypothetical protein